ncbi:MAG TPA: alpha/beta hydrolase [Ramlibacter sp.]|nr:alpha/beta hydrolase [Ramlibacter sp.]
MEAGRRAALLGLPALLAGCSATSVLDALVPRDSYAGQTGLAYGPDARHRIDVFRPLSPAAAAPLVLFFYGGNWARGERADYRFVGESLAAAGAVALVADYRLSPAVRWQDILADCALAAHWAFEHAADLGTDARRIHLMGHSAGAYNAAMLALDGRWLGRHNLAPRQLAGWIGIAGPYDFLPISDPDAQRAFDWPRTPPDSQPIAQVSAAAPRSLLLAAASDSVVNPQRSTAGLADRLRRAGVPVQLRMYERVNHATVLGALAGPLRWLAPVRADVLGFLSLEAV